MKATIPALLFAAIVAAAFATNPETASLVYEVKELKGKVLLEVEPEPKRLRVGDTAESGDRLRTKGSSQAVLFVRSHAVHFLLGPKTRCSLTHGRPGVLIHVERGRIRATFDAWTGAERRIVTTPSAVLAVRGTEYGLEVHKDGDTWLVVFAGVVEVLDPTGVYSPLRVEAGYRTRIRINRPPEPPKEHRIQPRDWDQGYTTRPPGQGTAGLGSAAGPGAMGSQGAGQGAGQGGSKRRGG